MNYMSWSSIAAIVFLISASSKASAGKDHYQSICENFLVEAKSTVQSLMRFIPKKDYKNIKPRYKKILRISKKNCENPKVTSKLKTVFNEYLSVDQKKIAILIPKKSLSGEVYAKLLKKMAKDSNLEWKFKTYTTASLQETKKDKTLQALAQAILIDGVDMVLGGFGRTQSELIKAQADKIRIPSLLLHGEINSDQDDTAKSLSYRVAPDPTSLVKGLLSTAMQRGVKNLAILATEKSFDSQFAKTFKTEALKAGLSIVKEIKYEGQNTDQLDLAVKALLEIDREKRAEEFAALVEEKKALAETNVENFRLSGVYLDPVVDFDAIFVPDDFRQTRFAAKMLQFYGLKETAMLGGPRWRAKEMVDPYDPFLKHSFFADNIGYYSGASPYIRNTLKIEENHFLSPKKTMLFDMALVAEKVIKSLHNLGKNDSTRSYLFSEWVNNAKTAGPDNSNLWHRNAYVFGFEKGTIALKSRPEKPDEVQKNLNITTGKNPLPTKVH